MTADDTMLDSSVDQTSALLLEKLSDKACRPTWERTFAAGDQLRAAKEMVTPARAKLLSIEAKAEFLINVYILISIL
ncbi:hypothetical protein V8F33_000136 [Rhypophila sp. PSN 637]